MLRRRRCALSKRPHFRLSQGRQLSWWRSIWSYSYRSVQKNPPERSSVLFWKNFESDRHHDREILWSLWRHNSTIRCCSISENARFSHNCCFDIDQRFNIWLHFELMREEKVTQFQHESEWTRLKEHFFSKLRIYQSCLFILIQNRILGKFHHIHESHFLKYWDFFTLCYVCTYCIDSFAYNFCTW